MKAGIGVLRSGRIIRDPCELEQRQAAWEVQADIRAHDAAHPVTSSGLGIGEDWPDNYAPADATPTAWRDAEPIRIELRNLGIPPGASVTW